MPDIVRGNIPQYVPVKQTDVIKPSAYLYSTPPTHQKGQVNGLRNASSGASIGSFLGPYGSLVGAAVGLGTDIWQAVYAKKRAKEANEQSAKAAQEQAARAHAESVSSREWNSEQQQIRRMRMAGLSPGLMYGQMSPSSAQQASPEQQQVHKADTPKFDNESLLRALELLVKQQQADTAQAAQQSTSELQGSQTQLNLIDSLTRNQKNLEEIANLLQMRSKLLSDENLSDAKRLEIYGLFDERLRNLIAQTDATNASARQSNANANVTEQTGVDLAKSQTSANKAAARNANATAQITEDFGAPAAAAEIARNTAVTYLTDQQRKSLMLEYNLKSNQYKAVQNWLSSHGFDESYAPLLMLGLENLASSMGTEVTSLVDDLVHFPANFIRGLIDRQMQVGSMMLNKIR